MKETQTIVTRHAAQRLKERNGLNKKSLQRISDRAYMQGVTYEDTKGNLKKWLSHLYSNSPSIHDIRVYGDMAFLFSGRHLITVLWLPLKIRLRSTKNYYINREG